MLTLCMKRTSSAARKKYGGGVLEGQLHFHSLQICVGFGKTAPNIVVSSTLKSTPFLVRRQIMRLLGLADFFKFRACLAGRYLCSQNVNKYSKQPAKPSKHVIQFRIRNGIDFNMIPLLILLYLHIINCKLLLLLLN